mmetsp:Transcript_64466/g.180256  ORF Transcript_64466/g.180256 Transcript_64466/m.180256 type:complete len:238 (-) Transcript_64466:294-1007(-)
MSNVGPTRANEHLPTAEACQQAAQVRVLLRGVVGEERHEGIDKETPREGDDGPRVGRVEQGVHDLAHDGAEHHALNPPQVLDHGRSHELREQDGDGTCDAGVVGAEEVRDAEVADGKAGKDREESAQRPVEVRRVREHRAVPQGADRRHLVDAREVVGVVALLAEVLREAQHRPHEAREVQREGVLGEEVLHALLVPLAFAAVRQGGLPRFHERLGELGLALPHRRADLADGDLLDP